jgi:four helix bundle protein
MMTQPFGHEKLIVYQKGMRFASVRGNLLEEIPRRVAACDHLDRGAESILVNIAHSSATWSPEERVVYLGNANGSALECAACLDVLVAKNLLTADEVFPGKSLLVEVVSILITLRKTAANRIRENRTAYRTRKGRMFDHEDLDAYQIGLELIAWLESMLPHFVCSADLRSKLDKTTTSIILNIAEGNGRFTGADQAKFYETAYKATIRSAALVDLATINTTADASRVEQGRELLRRMAAMITGLSDSTSND